MSLEYEKHNIPLAKGLCILRFSNLELDRQFSAVCDTILHAISNEPERRAP